jgi:hypothetical protein
MKLLLIIFILITSVFAATGKADTQAKNTENSRLCKIFKLKAEMYKKHMRDDAYAYKTLYSYEQRAEKFCKKVQ